MELYMISQVNGASQKLSAGREVHHSSSGMVARIHGCLNGASIESNAIAGGSKIAHIPRYLSCVEGPQRKSR
jgi:hypothetical protein